MHSFTITHKLGKARVGQLITAHGVVETPYFNPVGTLATVKAIAPRDLTEIGIQMVLANTYHLMLRPGEKVIKKLGGLHRFMNWNKPIMTDSGGFQVFSLGVALEHGVGKMHREEDTGVEQAKPRLNKVTEEGVLFQSHLDGSKHLLTPESSIQIQFDLGADLIVAFDDHESSKYSKEEMIKSLELTERWGLRSLEEYKRQLSAISLKTKKSLKAEDSRPKTLLYGVVHGAWHKDLRVRSAQFTDKYFDGIAIGGIYETKKMLYQMVEWVVSAVSEDKPRHLLGIGEVRDLFEGVEQGIDLFDCVAPTRRARNGSLYISPASGIYTQRADYQKNNFTTAIRNSRFIEDPQPVDPTCFCYTCKNFSRAYLRHLFMSGEILFHYLATYHNLYFINNLVTQIRESIKQERFYELKKKWLDR